MEGLIDFLWSPEPIIAMQSWLGPGWTPLAHFLSLLGDTAAALVLYSLLRWRAGRVPALALVGLFMLTGLVDMGLWQLIGLERPDDPRIAVHTTLAVSSFPSGHTVTSLCLFGWLALRGQIPWLVPWLVVPLVMLARLSLGAHYVGDVLGGVLTGLLLLWLYTRLWPPLRRWGERRSLRFFVSFGTGMVATLAVGVFLFGGDARAWQVLGFFAGWVPGVLVDQRKLGDRPPTEPHARRFSQVALGFAVLVALLVPAVLGAAPPLQGVLFFLALLWGALLFPWLLARRNRRGGQPARTAR